MSTGSSTDRPPESFFKSVFEKRNSNFRYFFKEESPYGYLSGPPAKYVLKKTQEFAIPATESASLSFELGPYTDTHISPAFGDVSTAILHTEAGGSKEKEARELLNSIHLSRYGSNLVVSSPLDSRLLTSVCAFHVQAIPTLPIEVHSFLARVEVVKIAGPVSISFSYGRATLLETTGEVNVRTSQGGKIVFAGCRGQVALKAGGGIDLKLTEEQFHGSLEATTFKEPLRILLPQGFLSSFEAMAPEVICRAEISLQQRQSETGIIAQFGSDKPRLRFHSFQGPIVIDTI